MAISFKAILAGAALATTVGASAASADPITFYYSFTGTSGSYVAFGSGNGDNIGVNGSANVTNSAGTTFKISAGATGSSVLPEPNFNTSTLDVTSGGGGSIYIAVVESGLTAQGFSSFNIGFTNNNSSVAANESFYVINSGTATLVATRTMAPNTASNATYVAPTLGSTYSISELYSATFTASGQTLTATINEAGVASTVPEPVSIALLGSGLVGFGFIRRKRS